MDIRRWTHVVAVADRLSFVRAAEQVNLSQPALTRSIQAAESELGLLLFDRSTQEVRVTPAGEFVIARARQLVFDSRCLERDLALYREGGLGDTAFGVGPFPAATFLPGLLTALRREHPEVKLRVEINNWQLLLERLLEEDIEFFVAETRDLPSNAPLKIRLLRPEAGGFYVRAGHPLARRRKLTLADAWVYGVATVRVPRSVRGLLAGLLGLPPEEPLTFALECDDIEVLKAVSLGCDLVLAAPRAAVASQIASGEFKLLAIEGLPRLGSRMGAVTLRGRTPSPMAALILERLPTES